MTHMWFILTDPPLVYTMIKTLFCILISVIRLIDFLRLSGFQSCKSKTTIYLNPDESQVVKFLKRKS